MLKETFMNKLFFLVCLIIIPSQSMEKDRMKSSWVNTTGTFTKVSEEEGVYVIYNISRDRNQFAVIADIRTSGEMPCRRHQLSKSAGQKDIEHKMEHIVVVSSPGMKRKYQNKTISITGTEESGQYSIDSLLNTKLLQATIVALTLLNDNPSARNTLFEIQCSLKPKWIAWRKRCLEDPKAHFDIPEDTSWNAWFNPYLYEELKKVTTTDT